MRPARPATRVWRAGATLALLLAVGGVVTRAVESSHDRVLPEIAGDSPAEVPVEARRTADA